MLVINTDINQSKLIYFLQYYPLSDQDYKILGGMKEKKEFNGYLYRRIRKFASKVPELQPFLKDVLLSRRMNKSLSRMEGSSDDTHSNAIKMEMYKKMEMLLDALIAGGEHKSKQGV